MVRHDNGVLSSNYRTVYVHCIEFIDNYCVYSMCCQIVLLRSASVDRFMPCLKYIVQNAISKELRLLRGKTIECISLIGLAVSREKVKISDQFGLFPLVPWLNGRMLMLLMNIVTNQCIC